MRVAQRRSRCIRFLLALVIWSAPALAHAQDEAPPLSDFHKRALEFGLELIDESFEEKAERFRLFNGCAPINLIVEDLPDDAANIDLAKKRIQTMAESRLRAARLFDAKALPSLYISIGVLVSENRRGGAFNINVQLRKYLRDSALNLNGFATTWMRGSFGTHGGNAGYILQGLSEFLDEFILEYLRVNEAACRLARER